MYQTIEDHPQQELQQTTEGLRIAAYDLRVTKQDQAACRDQVLHQDQVAYQDQVVQALKTDMIDLHHQSVNHTLLLIVIVRHVQARNT